MEKQCTKSIKKIIEINITVHINQHFAVMDKTHECEEECNVNTCNDETCKDF